MKFGDLLKHCRQSREWTQPEAAEQIGIEQSYLSKLETGKSMPSEDVFGRLVEVYALEPTELVDTLFPVELDRLRSIAAVRDAILGAEHRRQRSGRGWLVAGVVALALGGGLVGLAQIGHGGTVQYFSYQSPGIEVTEAGVTTTTDDEQMQSTEAYRGPSFTETLPEGRRSWGLVGGYERARVGPYRMALVPGLALLMAGLGCFFVSLRWR